MESVLGRYRNLIILVGVLFLQVLGLAVQVKRTTENESTRLIRVWTVSAVSPFEKAIVWTQSSTAYLWHNYFYLRGVRAENRQLKAEIEALRLEQVRLNQDAEQARRLQSLLGFKEQFIAQTIAAQVIGSSGSEQSRSIYIDKGTRDGIKPDMAVITADGIVGKVLRVFHSTSLVLLIDDQSSGVGAILEKSRLQGVLRGSPSGEVVMEKVMSDEQVQLGEVVLTSGGDRIFPKGLPVGRVSKVSPGSELFLNIRVKPAANLGKLEEVLVVTKVDEKEAPPMANGPVRAIDILAQRLPSVPDKPPAPDTNKPKDAAGPGPSPSGTGPGAVSANADPSKPGSAAPNATLKPKAAATGTATGHKLPNNGPAASPNGAAAAKATAQAPAQTVGANTDSGSPAAPRAGDGTSSSVNTSATKVGNKAATAGTMKAPVNSRPSAPQAAAGQNATTVSPKPSTTPPQDSPQ
ncbi:MAG TPA: rod shape-determining protein MreC [Terriglobales bacterium]|nr:rod shape-determining protein MreC [Terriglobales bacterium]